MAPTSDIRIGQGIISRFGRHLRRMTSSSRVLIVTDDNVAPLHASSVTHVLEDAGFTVFMHTFPHGERSKSLTTYETIVDEAVTCRIGRTDVLVALGGGVVGDVTGFVAATYLRGVDWSYVPTTLLAMVDASIGGKTGLDLPTGKNLIGAFHLPSLVLIDTMFLHSLPPEQISNGMAEVIKTCCLMGIGHLTSVENAVDGIDALGMITRCVNYKRHVVDLDAFDEGARKRLNFGHTVGHALERISGYGMPHGEAVAVGMLEELSIASDYGIKTEALHKKLKVILKKNHLPTFSGFDWPDMVDAMHVDKKNRDGKIVFEIPDGCGAVHEMALTRDQLLGMRR